MNEHFRYYKVMRYFGEEGRDTIVQFYCRSKKRAYEIVEEHNKDCVGTLDKWWVNEEKLYFEDEGVDDNV